MIKLYHYHIKDKENRIIQHIITDISGNTIAKCRFENQIQAYIEKKVGKRFLLFPKRKYATS